MSSNVVNQVAFLRTSREFPPDLAQLSREMNKGWIDLANAMNNRTISLFPTNRPAQTGESWFLINNNKQESLRQLYTFTTTADIPIGFKISSINSFSKQCGGQFTDGTNWYGLINASNVAIAGQISFYVALNGASTTSDSIKFLVGAGAPALTSGTIVLEWISQV